jgi:hypothetical protein
MGGFNQLFSICQSCRDVWLYLSHTSLSSYQRAIHDVNLSPEQKQAHAIQQITGRIDKVGAHNKESAGDNQRRWLATKINQEPHPKPTEQKQ